MIYVYYNAKRREKPLIWSSFWLGYFMFCILIKKKKKTDEKTYYNTSAFLGTLLIGLIFTDRKPFGRSDISLMGGF